MKFRIVTTLLQPVVEIEVDPEDYISNTFPSDPPTEDQLRDAALDDFHYHHRQHVVNHEIERIEDE